MAIIEVNDLYKEYKINQKKEGVLGAIGNIFYPRYISKVAVNKINFSIEEGEAVGYIGANGAGKSTTIKMLTGILTPTSGRVLVNGNIPYKHRVKNNSIIGAVFGQRTQMWWDLPPIETYKLIQKIYDVPKKQFDENLSTFTELLDLKELIKIPVRQLSLGQKMRCEIAAAFIHDPKIVYLDEPTIGLDIMVKDKIRNFIKNINKKRSVTVILTTHDLQDIEEVCKRVIIIDNGQVVYDGKIEEIKNSLGKYRTVHFQVKNCSNNLDNVLDTQKEYLFEVSKSPYDIQVKFDRQKITASEVMNIISPYCDIMDLTIQEPSIESIVRDLYRKQVDNNDFIKENAGNCKY
ncbi:MAG: ATP-binding cassette domain-containing protein [Clostridia bacterium]|nr:ATP-binding cassette domain-containing protein [Clostridia bacterium]